MKFVKVYSNSEIFKPIIFSESNINFILSDGHSVGKTKFFELIDYCLFKDKPQFLKFEQFKQIIDLSFFLEVQVNEKFITIKRDVNKSGGNFIKITESSIDCLDEKEFNFNGGGQEKAKAFFNDLLGFKILDKEIEYRQYISYFLRTQDDQTDVFKLNKFKGKDIDYKPIISNLLEIDGKLIKNKYELENNIENLEKEIKALEMDIGLGTTRDYIVEEISVLSKMKNDKEKLFQEFDFYLEENKISKELVNSIEKDISLLNEQRNSLNREIEYINRASSDNLLVDIKELNNLFQELNAIFPEQIKVEYEKVIDFNKNLTDERINILKANKEQFIEELNNVEQDLYALNNKRKEMLSVLNDSDTMSKFKKIEKELIELETNIHKEKQLLEKFDLLESKLNEVEVKKEKLKNVIKSVQQAVSEFNKSSLIKKTISELARIIFNEEALFSVGLNTHKNIEFNLKLSSNNNFDNLRDDGNTFRKLLSFLFSIAILINYRDKNFFKFAALDSPFDGDRIEYQEGLYKAIQKVANEYDLQIIITTVFDEIKIKELQNEAKKHEIRYLTEEDKLLGSF